ncbi:hypothetical protein [Hoylesella enoeca]|uniref:hypothetical protein n=1 Tax=Hoylesella enoeca TaxID=76123 RepID=UPI000AA69543
MKKMMTLATCLLFALIANAQMLNPVKFSTQLKTNKTAEARLFSVGKSMLGGMCIQLTWEVTGPFPPRLM